MFPRAQAIRYCQIWTLMKICDFLKISVFPPVVSPIRGRLKIFNLRLRKSILPLHQQGQAWTSKCSKMFWRWLKGQAQRTTHNFNNQGWFTILAKPIKSNHHHPFCLDFMKFLVIQGLSQEKNQVLPRPLGLGRVSQLNLSSNHHRRSPKKDCFVSRACRPCVLSTLSPR